VKYLRCLPIILFGRICDFCSKISFVENGEDDEGKSSVARLSRKAVPCSTTNTQNWIVNILGRLGEMKDGNGGSDTSIVSSIFLVGWVVAWPRGPRGDGSG